MNTAVIIGEVRPLTTEELIRTLYGSSVEDFAKKVKSDKRYAKLFDAKA